jgi:hypothetical protein
MGNDDKKKTKQAQTAMSREALRQGLFFRFTKFPEK